MKNQRKPNQNSGTFLIAENNHLKIENSKLYREKAALQKQVNELTAFAKKITDVSGGGETLLCVKNHARKLLNLNAPCLSIN